MSDPWGRPSDRDPALEAASRAFSDVEMDDLTYAPRRTQILMIEAARQALRPIRDRHTPRTDTFGSVECVHCGYLWPCPDAQKCYTTAELEATE